MKKYFLLLLFLLGSLLLIGCTNTGRSQDFEVLKVDDLKGEQIKITIKARSGVVVNPITELKKRFEKYAKNELGLDIEVTVATVTGDYDLLRETTIYDINTGVQENIPDLILGYPDHFAEYRGGGNLVDLQKFIDDPHVGYTKEELADFIPSYLTENRGFDEENPSDLYGLPFNKSTEVMIYNKTAFEALYGENYLNSVPKTWDEVKAISEDIIKKVKNGDLDKTFVKSVDPKTGEKIYLKVSDYFKDPNEVKFYPFGYDSSDNAFITLTRQFGGLYTSRDSIYKGYVEFDNQESRSAMDYFQKMKNNGLFATPAIFDKKYNSDALNDIRVLMTVGSTAGVGYNDNKAYEYELAAAPIPYYNSDAKYVIQQGTNIGMLNHNNDKQKLAAWLFVKFCLSPENTAFFAMETGGYLPVRLSAFETEDYIEYLENPTNDKKVYSAAANIALNVYLEQNFKFFVDAAFIGSSDVRKEAGRIFDSIIVNNKDIQERYRDAYRALTPYVKKA